MNNAIIAYLQASYEADDFDKFIADFCWFYRLSNTAERLTLLLHFSCEWYMAETCELPRMIAEIA